jgi:hypothetical protein
MFLDRNLYVIPEGAQWQCLTNAMPVFKKAKKLENFLFDYQQ